MKKITIFLLTFLLFVGFYHVNAQRTSDPGPLRTAFTLDANAVTGMYCVEPLSTNPVEITVNFSVINGTIDSPLSDHKVFWTTDGSAVPRTGPGQERDPLWNQVDPSKIHYGPEGLFWVIDNIIETTYYYGEVAQNVIGGPNPSADTLFSNVIKISVIEKNLQITLEPNPLLGRLCDGASVTLNGLFQWLDGNDDPVLAEDGTTLQYYWLRDTTGFGPEGTGTIIYGEDDPIIYASTHTFGPLNPRAYNFTFGVNVVKFGNTIAHNCNAKEIISRPITVFPQSTMNITVTGLNDGEICEGGNISVQASTTVQNTWNGLFGQYPTLRVTYKFYLDDDSIHATQNTYTSYQFTAGGALNNLSTAGLEPGPHTIKVVLTLDNVTGGLISNCETIEIIEFEVLERPTVTVEDGETCLNEELSIVAIATGGTEPYATYTWTPIGITGTAVVDTFKVNTSVAVTGKLVVRVTDDKGCISDRDTATVTIHPLPEVTLDLTETPEINNIQGLFVCEDQEAFVLMGGLPEGGVYSGPGVTFDATEEVYMFDPTSLIPARDYEIVYTYTDTNGCVNTDTNTVRVRRLPLTHIEYAPLICAKGKYPVTRTAVPPFTLAGTAGGTYTVEPNDLGLVIDPVTGELDVNNAQSGEYVVTYTFSNAWCSNFVTDTITVNVQPVLGPIEQIADACVGQPTTLTVTVTPAGTPIEWKNVTAGWITVSPNVTGPITPVEYAAIATTLEGCADTTYYVFASIPNPVTNITITNITSPLCNYTEINLSASVTAAPGTTQTYAWYMRTFNGSTWSAYAPTGVTTLNGAYLVSVDDAVVQQIQFELRIGTEGYNCPISAQSNVVTILPNIKVVAVGAANDTVCHGGSTQVKFAASLNNLAPGNKIYYRWLENNVFYEGADAWHELPAGVTEISMTTHPSLHPNENGPESYCYSVEVIQLPYTPNPIIPIPANICRTFSACYMVTVLKDAALTISGPIYVQKDANIPPVFTASAIGGYGTTTYEWYLNGVLVPNVDGANYTMDDINVLGTVGNHNVAVRITQNISGCEAGLVVHNFFVVNGCGMVNIVGPASGCVGDAITLTAVVEAPDYVDYTLQWKQGGQILIGATGQTYQFTVTDNVDLLDFVVEVTCGGCDVDISAPHDFQVIPRTVVLVDNYMICENGGVEVTAEAIVFGEGQIYRYIWYDEAEEPIDTTYVNKRFFDYSEMTDDVTTFYVSVQMLHAVCSSELAEFTITKQGALDSVEIIPSAQVACLGSFILFTLGDDNNAEEYGDPTISWWVNGVQIPGESLPYINVYFSEPGTHYIEARLVYPYNNCEYVTNSVTVEIIPAPTVTISGPSIICENATGATLYANTDPVNAKVTYQWLLHGQIIDTATGATLNIAQLEASPFEYSFTVQITDTASGCVTLSAMHNVYVNEFPVIGITADKTEICSGETVMLKAEIQAVPNIIYQWYIVGEEENEEIENANAPILYVNPTATTTYTFTATQIESGCKATSNEVTVTVIPTPVVTYTTPIVATICQGEQVTFTATITPATNVTVTWYINGEPQGATLNPFTHIFDQPGVFDVKVSATSNVGGCTSTIVQAGTITVKAAPTVSIVGPNAICNNQGDITLQAIVTPNTATVNYQWYENENPVGTNAATQVINNAPGLYFYRVKITDTQSGCVVFSEIHTVEVGATLPKPVLTISSNTICNGEQITISGNINGTYTWYKNGALTDFTGQTITDQPTAGSTLTSYTYTATVSVNDGCISEISAPVTVVVHPTFTVDIYGENKVCFQATEGMQLVLHAQHASQPGVQYLYELKYVKGQSQPVVVKVYEIPDMIVPNDLEPNDPADPYFFFVEVTAVGYGCIATSGYHKVDILPQPTVALNVDKNAICLGAAITVTAYPTPAPTPENPYDYVWKVNGIEIFGTNEIVISDGLNVGVNEISVEIVRTQDGYACSGSNSILVNVVEVPTLVVTHDFENGLLLPAICVGGKVNLYAAIVDFDENLIDIESFKYEWRRDGQPIATEYNFYTEKLYTPGTYKYEVRAYNTELGCYSSWTAFEDIIVAPQPSVEINLADNNVYDVCQGAILTLFPTLGDNHIAYQKGEYVWSDATAGLVIDNEIPPHEVTLKNIGITTYTITVMFENPTCAIATADRSFNVTTNPTWVERYIYPDPYAGICPGTELTLHAVVEGGVDPSTNVGVIIWEYKIDNGEFMPVAPGHVGGIVNHTPTVAGTYTYRVTYNPTNPLTACELASHTFNPFTVFPAPSATFNEELSSLQSCANDPFADVKLVIDLVGTPPFNFVVEGDNGFRRIFNNVLTTSYTVDVKPIPTVTTQFMITSLTDGSGCTNVILGDVIVRVTKLEVVDSYIEICDLTFDVRLNITEAISNIATVTFEGFAPATYTIKSQGSNSVITVNVPEGITEEGNYNVSIEIDGCKYWIVVNVGIPQSVTATFDTQKTVTQICANDPATTTVDLYVTFTGTPPFLYRLVGTDGTRIDNIVSFNMNEVFTVTPVATTTYAIELLEDNSTCVKDGYVKPEITITVTDVKIMSPEVLACDDQITVDIQVISAISNLAYVTFDSEASRSYPIRQGLNTLEIRIPSNVTIGTHTVTIEVDECIYTFTVIYGANGVNQFVHRRWEGYGEVLVVSNNYADPANPYYNGGYMFTSYQWYKNGDIIPGATQQFYQDPNGVNGIYSVRLTGYKVDKDGNKLSDRITFNTCGDEFNSKSTINVYPVPARVNEAITVEIDLTPAELEGAVLDIYDAKGAHIQHIPVVSSRTLVDGFKAQGTYFGRITTGTNETKAVKFVIAK